LCLSSLIACTSENKNDLTIQVSLGQSGRVTVSASAEGAISYRYSFGENAVFNSTEETYSYVYPDRGTYTVAVWAFFDANNENYTYQSVEIEVTSADGSNIDASGEAYIDTSEEVTTYAGYNLVWNDEFNYSGAPKDAKWHLQYIPIFGGGWANGEEQHYTVRRDNSYVSDGTLKIVAKKESYTYAGSRKNYTSARLNSKFDIEYGRIDVRAKLPASAGTWPAIWTLGTNVNERGNYHGNTDGSVGWPACGEIDIMEQSGSNKNEVIGFFHWGDTQTNAYGNYGETRSVSALGLSDLTENFHVYSVIWTRASLKIFIDDVFIVSLNNTANVPYDNPHYLILNIAMGGNLGGAIPSSFEEDTMEVDYVRFYQ
jgi:beta-glucanase (GH16 family)